MALVYIRPDADSVDGSWVNASGNNTNLYDSVDESVASDSDYIRSSDNPANDIVKLRLSNFASTPIQPMTVRYRFKKVVSAGEVLSMKARLVQGSTTIAEWEHSEVDDTYVDAEQELTSGQFALISDFTDLYLEFEAISGALEIDSFSASYLLTDEDSGFAINATYPGDTEDADYVGAPIAGSVSATSYYNAPLDASNLTQAGTSPKTVHWHEAPYVRWSPHNLVQQSQTFSLANWDDGNAYSTADATTAPDGTVTGDLFGATASNAYAATPGTVTTIADAAYTVSMYFKKGNVDYVRLIFSDSGGNEFGSWFNVNTGVLGSSYTAGAETFISASITSVGNGWYRCAATGSSTQTVNKLVVTMSSTDSGASANGNEVYMWGAQMVRGYNALPYLVTTSAARIGIPQGYDIDYDIFGMLVEPAATNLALRSEAIDNVSSWSTSNVTFDDDSTAAPNGATTADTLIENSSNANHSVYQAITVSNTTVYTASVYLKAKERTYVALSMVTGASNRYAALFNLSDGTVTTTNSVGTPVSPSNAIVAVGNGWYRCSVTATTDGTAGFIQIGLSSTSSPTWANNLPTYTGDNASGAYVWGTQFETGSVATSYIPTLGSTVTRAGDTVTALTSSFSHSATENTWYADFKIINEDAPTAGANVWEVYQSTTNRYAVYNDSSADFFQFDDDASLNVDIGNYVQGTRHQIAAAFKSSDFDASVDGGSAVSTGSGTYNASATTTLILAGSVYGVAENGNMLIYRLVQVPRQVETEDGTLETWRYAF